MTNIATRQQRVQTVRPVFAFLDDRGIRRTWLADRLGVSRSRLHTIETGIGRIPDGFMERACRELGIPRWWIGGPEAPAQRRRKSA